MKNETAYRVTELYYDVDSGEYEESSCIEEFDNLDKAMDFANTLTNYRIDELQYDEEEDEYEKVDCIKTFISNDIQASTTEDDEDELQSIINELEGMGYDTNDENELLEGLGAGLGYDRESQQAIIKAIRSR